MELLVRTTMAQDIDEVVATAIEVANLFCLKPEVANGLVKIIKSFYFSKEKRFDKLKDAINYLVLDISSDLMQTNNLNEYDKRLLKFSRNLKEILYKDLSCMLEPSFKQVRGTIQSSVKYCLISSGMCNPRDTFLENIFNYNFSLETI